MPSIVVLVVPPFARAYTHALDVADKDAIWSAIQKIIAPTGRFTDWVSGLDTNAHRMSILAADDIGDLTEREQQEQNRQGWNLVSGLRHARYASRPLQLFYGTLVVLRDPPIDEEFTLASMSLTPRELAIAARELSFECRHENHSSVMQLYV